jgi:CxxC motif-containing protein
MASVNRNLAKVCVNCPVCRRARRKQRGIAYALVKKVEGSVCPFGRSYERVHGRKPHEPVSPVDMKH